jgi:hypothetical protein
MWTNLFRWENQPVGRIELRESVLRTALRLEEMRSGCLDQPCVREVRGQTPWPRRCSSLCRNLEINRELPQMIDMTKHREARALEKSEAIETIERTLERIENEHREADLWERVFLQQAVEWLYRGGYRAAAVNAALALTPVNKRSEVGLKSDDLLDRCDIALLRAALKEGVEQPLHDFTAFGPIVLAH